MYYVALRKNAKTDHFQNINIHSLHYCKAFLKISLKSFNNSLSNVAFNRDIVNKDMYAIQIETNQKLCLRFSVTWSVFIILGHRVSILLWDKDCLHYSGTWSPKEDKVSTLLCHRECLLCYGIRLHYYGIASSLVCQSDLSTLVCLVSSLVLAPFISQYFTHYVHSFMTQCLELR